MLDIVIDIPNSKLRMSQERQNEILYELKIMSHVKVVTKKKMSLIGKLSFVTILKWSVSSGRIFLRHLINLAKSVRYLHYKVKMNVQARRDIAWWIENVIRRDIAWWIENVINHSRRCMFPLPWVTTNTFELWSDMSDIGAGAINNEVCKNYDIMELIRELYSILSQTNMECHCMYMESSHNVIADALSRLEFYILPYFKPNFILY